MSKPDHRCYICGSTKDIRIAPEWLTGLGKPWCYCCFSSWYDYGKTDLDEVREQSLALQGFKKEVLVK